MMRLYKIRVNIGEGKLARKKAMAIRIAKSVAKRILRDTFRKTEAKKNGMNWKRIRITNWKTKEYMIA